MDDRPHTDYVWHFKLTDPEPRCSENPLTQMVEEQVTALLHCIVFTRDGEDVRVTGFRFLDSPGTEHVLPRTLPDPDPEAEQPSR